MIFLSPRIFANSFYNNKDIIFLSFFDDENSSSPLTRVPTFVVSPFSSIRHLANPFLHNVVFPIPGGPQSIIDGINLLFIAVVMVPFWPIRCVCPISSDIFLGLIRSANGILCILANTFYQSKEYQEAHIILKGYAERQFQIVEGI